MSQRRHLITTELFWLLQKKSPGTCWDWGVSVLLVLMTQACPDLLSLVRGSTRAYSTDEFECYSSGQQKCLPCESIRVHKCAETHQPSAWSHRQVLGTWTPNVDRMTVLRYQETWRHSVWLISDTNYILSFHRVDLKLYFIHQNCKDYIMNGIGSWRPESREDAEVKG